MLSTAVFTDSWIPWRLRGTARQQNKFSTTLLSPVSSHRTGIRNHSSGMETASPMPKAPSRNYTAGVIVAAAVNSWIKKQDIKSPCCLPDIPIQSCNHGRYVLPVPATNERPKSPASHRWYLPQVRWTSRLRGLHAPEMTYLFCDAGSIIKRSRSQIVQ